jgi:hypothetical protein
MQNVMNTLETVCGLLQYIFMNLLAYLTYAYSSLLFVFFCHLCTFRFHKSLSTCSSHLNLDVPTFLLPSQLKVKKVKLSLCLIKHYAMKAYGGVDVWIHIFLTSALAGGEWSASFPCRFTLGERAPGTHRIGGWVGPSTGLEDLEKTKFLTLLGPELHPLGCAARSQSLY